MKVLFVVKSLGHFSYVSSIIKELDKSCKVELLFNKKWSQWSKEYFVLDFIQKSNNVTLDSWAVERKNKRWIFKLREIKSYINYIRQNDQSTYYLKRWGLYLPGQVRKFFSYSPVMFILSHFGIYELLTLIEKCAPASKVIKEDLIKRKPDVVVVTPINHRHSEEIEYIKAAKALNIPTVTTALSWDSLSTKGVFHVIPDMTLVWNAYQAREAIGIHDVPKDKVFITGAPFFDKWFEPQLLEERDFFCAKVGIDANRPFFVYLGSSGGIVGDETWLIQDIYNKVKKNNKLKNYQMVVRPHPANPKYVKKLVKDDLIVYPFDGALPECVASQRNFYNILKHCEFTVGVNTSGMLDAIINTKPCLTLMVDKYKSTQAKAIHFKQLSKALKVSYSIESLIRLMELTVTEYQKNQRFIVKEFIRPNGLDIPAGQVAAMRIKKCCRTM